MNVEGIYSLLSWNSYEDIFDQIHAISEVVDHPFCWWSMAEHYQFIMSFVTDIF